MWPSFDIFANTTTIFNQLKPTYNIGAWNAYGWSLFNHPENSVFKTEVINP